MNIFSSKVVISINFLIAVFNLAPVLSSERFDVRLVNRTIYDNGFVGGRVEVRIDQDGTLSQWGTVCDLNWHDQDARVVCRMLGFDDSNSMAHRSTTTSNSDGVAVTVPPFGQGTGPIWLHNVECLTRHERLRDCHRAALNTSTCPHSRDAGVACFNKTLVVTSAPPTTTQETIVDQDHCKDANREIYARLKSLKGSPPGVGLVEIRNEITGEWGQICDDFWDTAAASVVCRMLCLNEKTALPGANSKYVGKATNGTSVILTRFLCDGTEMDLFSCKSLTRSRECSANEAATVTCQQPEVVDRPPRSTLVCNDRNMTTTLSQTAQSELAPQDVLARNCSHKARALARTSVELTIPYDDCETQIILNDTHITYVATVDVSAKLLQYTLLRKPYIYVFRCVFPRSGIVDKGAVIPEAEIIEHTATGRYKFSMEIYQDKTFRTPITKFPISVKVGEWLNIGVILKNDYTNVKLVVDTCRVTPTGSGTTPRFELIDNKCPDQQVTLFPQNRGKFTFNFKTFKFMGNRNQLFIQCDAIVCYVTEKSAACDQTCARKNRTKRSASAYMDGHTVYKINSPGPIMVMDDETESSNVPLIPLFQTLQDVHSAEKKDGRNSDDIAQDDVKSRSAKSSTSFRETVFRLAVASTLVFGSGANILNIFI